MPAPTPSTRLAPSADEEFRATSPAYGLDCAYAPNVWGADDLEGAFRARLGGTSRRRARSAGPRSSARTATTSTLAVRDLGARAFASHGETWAAALCLRLGLATAVAAEIGEPPLLLVDDPFSALDPRRRDRIGERLAARGGQVVITRGRRGARARDAAARLGRARPARSRARGA